VSHKRACHKQLEGSLGACHSRHVSHKRACRSGSAGGSAADVAAQRRCCWCCLQRLPHLLCTRGHNIASGATVTARVTRHVPLMPHCAECHVFVSTRDFTSSGAAVHPSARNSACVRAVGCTGLAHATPPFRPRPHVQPVTGGRSLLAAVTVIWDGLRLRLVRAVFVRAHSRMAASSGGGDGF